jgi:hypothetical protein
MLSVGGIFAATLTPLPRSHPQPFPVVCLWCADTALADSLRNLLLFVPLGAMLVGVGRTTRQATLLGGVLALFVELAQVAIPGRYPALGDVLFNALGSWLGGRITTSARSWPVASRHPARDALLASLGAVFVLGVTGVLLAPSYPRSTYFVGWTPDVGHLATYDGRVIDARVGELVAPHGRSSHSDIIRGHLLEGRAIRVYAEAGHPVPRLSALFDVVDERQREIVLLGLDGGDFVVRFRTLATALGLEGPEVRLSNAVRELQPGEPLEATAWRDRHNACARVGLSQGCAPGFTIGAGWSLVVPAQGLLPRVTQTLNGVWLAAVAFPVGFISYRGWWALSATMTMLLGVLIIPSVTPAAAVSPTEIAGVVVGLASGWIVRPWIARRRDRGAVVHDGGTASEPFAQFP